MKTVDLELRPVFHWTAPRVRAHVLLCMLAERTSPVAKARVAKVAYRRASTIRTEIGNGEIHPVHSFRSLLDDLATLTGWPPRPV